MSMYAVELAGVENARQLGGFKIGDKTVKYNKFLRSGTLNRLSGESARMLSEEYNLKYVADLRMSEEQDAFPDTEISGAQFLRLPVMERTSMDNPEIAAVFNNPESTLEDKFKILYQYDVINYSLYCDFLFKEQGKWAYRQFFQALLELDEQEAILWHCKDGKDRTGVASMLLLSALGASRETILEDYMLSKKFNREKLKKIRQLAWVSEMPPEQLERLLFISGDVAEGFMIHPLDVLHERYGSAEGYLSEELNVTSADLRHLREISLI